MEENVVGSAVCYTLSPLLPPPSPCTTNYEHFQVGALVEENVEDQLEVQGKKDHEKLVTLGLERARRDEENRLKKVSGWGVKY